MSETKLLAYHGQQSIKDKYVARVRAHRIADELVNGQYWKNGKGCAVGCTIHASKHARYETELGIPRALARLEDGIFERLSNDIAQEWPEAFLASINPGADLSMVVTRFLHWLLIDPKDGVIQFAKSNNSIQAINRVGEFLKLKISGEVVSGKEWNAAAYAADTAAYAADAAYAAYAAAAAAYAADTAAYAADTAYAADAAAAAYAADAAAYAAADAAYAAADAAYAADAADAAAARVNATKRQSEKLLELLREAL